MKPNRLALKARSNSTAGAIPRVELTKSRTRAMTALPNTPRECVTRAVVIVSTSKSALSSTSGKSELEWWREEAV